MEVPILVGIMSLAGTIIGGSIVTGGIYYLARMRQQAEDNKEAITRAGELRKACRLIDSELVVVTSEVEVCLRDKRWWIFDEKFTSEAWQQYKSVLADLPYPAWGATLLAVNAVHNLRGLAAAPRPTEEPEVVREPTVKAIIILQDHIEAGRRALLPYQ
jgi:hypothetical protein